MDGFLIFYGIASIILVIYICIYVLRKYKHPLTSPIATTTVLIGWIFSGVVIVLVPMDLVSEIHESDGLKPIFEITFWISFWFTWLIIPLQQSYFNSGDFTFKGKLWFAVKENLLFYAVAGVVFLALMIYIAAANGLGSGQIADLGMGLANLWGLAAAVLLLGYGLVEMPRFLWYLTDDNKNLDLLYFKVANINSELLDAEEKLRDAIQMVDTIQTGNQEYLNVVKAAVPQDITQRTRGRPDCFDEGLRDLCKEPNCPISTLASLHYRLKWDAFEYERASQENERLLEEACKLEDSMSASKHEIEGWKIKSWFIFTKSLAAICSVLSIFVLWGELTLLFQRPKWSVFAALVDSVKTNSAAVVIFGSIAIVYTFSCATYSMFQLRLLSFYNMNPGNSTSTSSLLFNVSLFLRFIFPLGYNFLLMTDPDGTKGFRSFIQGINDIPLLGDPVNIFLPSLMVIFCLCTWFNLFERVLKCLHIARYTSSRATNDEEVQDTVREGRTLVRRSKRGEKRIPLKRSSKPPAASSKKRTNNAVEVIDTGNKNLLDDDAPFVMDFSNVRR